MRNILVAGVVVMLTAASVTPSLARKAHHYYRYDRHSYGQSYDRDVPHYGRYLHSWECAPRYDSAGVAVGCL
jgi:hypothetical protein